MLYCLRTRTRERKRCPLGFSVRSATWTSFPVCTTSWRLELISKSRRYFRWFLDFFLIWNRTGLLVFVFCLFCLQWSATREFIVYRRNEQKNATFDFVSCDLRLKKNVLKNGHCHSVYVDRYFQDLGNAKNSMANRNSQNSYYLTKQARFCLQFMKPTDTIDGDCQWPQTAKNQKAFKRVCVLQYILKFANRTLMLNADF